jgi:two-component system sensor histidine kinase UhpB
MPTNHPRQTRRPNGKSAAVCREGSTQPRGQLTRDADIARRLGAGTGDPGPAYDQPPARMAQAMRPLVPPAPRSGPSWAWEASAMHRWLVGLPLFWRVFGTNAAVLALAFLGLVFAPVTVSVPPAATELVVLTAGLVCLLAINLILLRPAFRPLDELVETMRRHDPLSPGKRVRVDGGPAVVALAQAFNEMLDRLESERRDSARRALLVQEGERRRIARELHDEVGQTLTGVMLQVEGLAGAVPEGFREQLDELRETARQGTEEVRRLVRQLRPEALEDLGLQSALSALAYAVGEQAQIRIERRLEHGAPLSEEQELVVYRIAQEALTNVARHADATEVELRLRRIDEQVLLTVRDNGRGLPSGVVGSSHGILGMRERAMLIGAQLTLITPPGGGTEVRLSIPLEAGTD